MIITDSGYTVQHTYIVIVVIRFGNILFVDRKVSPLNRVLSGYFLVEIG